MRIQRIIRLVKSMEVRIEDMIITFGLKVEGTRKIRRRPSTIFVRKWSSTSRI